MGKNCERFRVFNIDWEVDEPSELDNLPTEVRCIIFKGVDVEDLNDREEVGEYLSEKLSDDYGFLHNGFDFEEY